MTQHFRMGLAATLVFFSSVGQAQPVIGGGYASSLFTEYNNLEPGSGYKAALGYYFEAVPLLIEMNYLDTGTMDEEAGPASLRFEGALASLGYRLVVHKRSGSSVQFKAGYYDGDTYDEFEYAAGFRRPPAESAGFVLGINGEWRVLPWLGMRLGWDVLFGVKDFFGGSDTHESDILVLNLGTVIGPSPARSSRSNKIKSREDAAAPSSAASVPEASQYVVPAQAPPQPVVAAPAPITPPPAALPPAAPKFVAGETAWAMPGAVLRSRPAADGQAVATLESGAPVTLKAEVKNITGAWWYAEASGQLGWVKESELQPKLP